MLARERQKVILEQLRLYGRIRATEMATELGVSEITLRRDLNELHTAGQLSRVHGGAVRHGTDAPGREGQILIGILVPGSVYYFSEVIHGAESVAESLNVRLVLGVSGGVDNESERVQRMLDLGVEGLLVTTTLGDGRAAELERWLGELPVPVVLMERSFGFPHVSRELDHVRSDHAHGAMLALRHLRDLGHESVALALSVTPTSYWLERGYHAAVEKLGMGAQPEPVELPHSPGGVAVDALEALLDDSLASDVRAFLVHNDTQASGLVDVAMKRGLRIPEDISVVAYDDVMAAMAAVPLTAVGPPKQSVGALALEQLIRRIGYPADRPGAVSHLSLLPTLQLRQSSGAKKTAI